MTVLKALLFDKILQHNQYNLGKLFNPTFLVWFKVPMKEWWSKCTVKLQNPVPGQCLYFFQINYLLFLIQF